MMKREVCNATISVGDLNRDRETKTGRKEERKEGKKEATRAHSLIHSPPRASCANTAAADSAWAEMLQSGSPRLLRRVEEFLSEVPVLAFDVPADGAYGSIRAELADQSRGVV